MICALCQRELVRPEHGACQYVMELEPGVYKRCGLERNGTDASGRYIKPADPHRWVRLEHVRDDRRDHRICKCRHPYHEGMCLACYDSGVWDLQVASTHDYAPGTIELDHVPRE